MLKKFVKYLLATIFIASLLATAGYVIYSSYKKSRHAVPSIVTMQDFMKDCKNFCGPNYKAFAMPVHNSYLFIVQGYDKRRQLFMSCGCLDSEEGILKGSIN